MEGIFRTQASVSKLKEVKDKIDKGDQINFKNEKIDPHVVAALIKGWFRELPDSLFTSDLYPSIVELGKEGLNKDPGFLDHVDVLIIQSGSIPKLNMVVITKLFLFLRSFLKTIGFT